MAAMAETAGPASRAEALCRALLKREHKVAFCAARDANFCGVESVRDYFAPVPSPLGMPAFVGKRFMKAAQSLGLPGKKKVNSFEQVLFFDGAIGRKFFAEDVRCLRDAIRDFRPDAVYAEARVAAIVAAKMENVKVAAGFSYPMQKSFASNPEFGGHVREFLRASGLPPVESVLELFDRADLKIVPSSYDLEPMDGPNIVFTGPFFTPAVKASESPRNKIVAYLGYGTIPVKTTVGSLAQAFRGTDFQVYLATKQTKPRTAGNLHIGERFDFGALMPEAAVYINHGGQNSIMTGLEYGVPQIVCPGSVFERNYNASSVVRLGAGAALKAGGFRAETIRKITDGLLRDPAFAANAKKAGEHLLGLGGVEKAAEAIESM